MPRTGVSITRGDAGTGKVVRVAVGEIEGNLENKRDCRRSEPEQLIEQGLQMQKDKGIQE